MSSTTDFIIRDFVAPGDYPVIAAIQTAVLPDTPAVLEDYRESDVIRPPKCKMRRWVAEIDGQPVGIGEYVQFEWLYHPQKFTIKVWVLPKYRRRGIGSALYDTITAALEPFDPVTLWAGTREDMPDGVRFLETRGYTVWQRFAESQLDLASFDSAPYDGLEDRLRQEKIILVSLAELAQTDPDYARKLYELDELLVQDVPGAEVFTQPPFEQWRKLSIDNESCLPEAYIVAVHRDLHGEIYIGESNLWSDRASDMLYTGLTATRREYRGRGIATAMKVKAIRWAQGNGNSLIKTDNEVGNAPMLAINTRLGFVKQPDGLDYELALRGDVPVEEAASEAGEV